MPTGPWPPSWGSRWARPGASPPRGTHGNHDPLFPALSWRSHRALDARPPPWHGGSPGPAPFGRPGGPGAILGRVEPRDGPTEVPCRFLTTAARSCLTRRVDLTGVTGPEAAGARVGAAFTDEE